MKRLTTVQFLFEYNLYMNVHTVRPPIQRWHYARFREVALPENLEHLTADLSGTPTLPNSLIWSGIRDFDLTNPYFEILFYEKVLNEARHPIILYEYLNGQRLRELWPELYPSRFVKSAWE